MLKHFTYQASGTCSQQILFDLDEEQRLHNVQFIGGCAGNTLGIASLVEGQRADEVIKRLDGIRCGYKNTSCPDQLAQALKQAAE